MVKTAGERLRTAREEAGYSNAADAARAFGFHPQNLRDHEADRRKISPAHAAAYAKAFRVDRDWLLFGGEPSANTQIGGVRTVPLIGTVQAGYWSEVNVDGEPFGSVPVFLPEYERADLFALKVVGRSMDKLYPEGTDVIVCPMAQAGVRDGDIVVVERRRNGLVETTLKQIVVSARGIELWPKSSDPAHQTPILLPARDNDSDNGIAVTGVVVGSFSKEQRGGTLIAF
jgi:SOS-response transcriptional repressor LexA